jgi:hypothetical protein
MRSRRTAKTPDSTALSLRSILRGLHRLRSPPGGTLGQGERDLGAVQGDPQRDHTGVFGHLDAIDQQRNQVQPGQVGREQLRQGMLGSATNRRETADFDVPELAWATWVPTGSSPAG